MAGFQGIRTLFHAAIASPHVFQVTEVVALPVNEASLFNLWTSFKYIQNHILATHSLLVLQPKKLTFFFTTLFTFKITVYKNTFVIKTTFQSWPQSCYEHDDEVIYEDCYRTTLHLYQKKLKMQLDFCTIYISQQIHHDVCTKFDEAKQPWGSKCWVGRLLKTNS